ncbi:MAG: DNA primase [Gammaproteobacteria bacterium]
MSRIPQDFIDDLMARVDIAEVIHTRVPLKKAGKEFKACCPFHSEKTPSFTVSSTKQFYHCFGCGAHGTALGFLMDHEHLGFVEAVEELAQMVGMEVPRETDQGERRPRDDLYRIMEQAASFYSAQLRKNQGAIDYLRKRGIDGETAARFSIGYAPDSWDGILKHIGQDSEKLRFLSDGGLIIERDQGGWYDRFRGRIMFPIKDARGRTIAFGGRVLDGGEPKYLNSPETILFHKGRELYGLFEARQALRSIPRLMVVEGYMDVVGLSQSGIPWAVATLGTATTEEHLRRLFRLTDEVVFCFDGDTAGRRAAWRALENALPTMQDGHQISFLFLPDGEDPDSLVGKEGAEQFERRLEDALPLSDYLINHLSEQVDMSSLDGRARMAELARPLMRRTPDGIYKDLLTSRLAETVGIDESRLAGQLASDRPREPSFRAATRGEARPPSPRSSLVRQAITLIVHQPGAIQHIAEPPDLAALELRGIPLLLELLEVARSCPDITTAGLLERWRDRPEHPHLMGLTAVEGLVSDEAAPAVLEDTLRRLAHREGAGRRTEALLQKARREGLNEGEKAELRTLLGDAAKKDEIAPKRQVT